MRKQDDLQLTVDEHFSLIIDERKRFSKVLKIYDFIVRDNSELYWLSYQLQSNEVCKTKNKRRHFLQQHLNCFYFLFLQVKIVQEIILLISFITLEISKLRRGFTVQTLNCLFIFGEIVLGEGSFTKDGKWMWCRIKVHQHPKIAKRRLRN